LTAIATVVYSSECCSALSNSGQVFRRRRTVGERSEEIGSTRDGPVFEDFGTPGVVARPDPPARVAAGVAPAHDQEG